MLAQFGSSAGSQRRLPDPGLADDDRYAAAVRGIRLRGLCRQVAQSLKFAVPSAEISVYWRQLTNLRD